MDGKVGSESPKYQDEPNDREINKLATWQGDGKEWFRSYVKKHPLLIVHGISGMAGGLKEIPTEETRSNLRLVSSE